MHLAEGDVKRRKAASASRRARTRGVLALRLARLGLVVGCLILATNAGADALFCESLPAGYLFCEDFESYQVYGDTNPGIPLVSEGALETWYGGRFEPHQGGTIEQDVAIRRIPSSFPDNVTYARFEDEAGILLNVSTLGVPDPILGFDWTTHKLDYCEDELVVGIYVGDIDFVNDTPDGPNDDLVRNFWIDGPGAGKLWPPGPDGWTEILRTRDGGVFHSEEFALPGNEESVWVAFWLDDGEGDYGKIDNVYVTPEPSTLGLLGLGLLGLAARRRRSAGVRGG